jgi:5-methylcytosine-specific restriction protein B
MQQGNCVAIGWADVGDLSHITYDKASKEKVRQALETRYPSDPRVRGRKAQEIFNFVATLHEGDLVLPADGQRILGFGRVVGDYSFEPGSDAPHRRPVAWLSWEAWDLPERECLQTTVCELGRVDILP